MEKVGNEIKNVFLHDRGNNLRNLSSNISTTSETTIVAETGVIEKKIKCFY